MCLRNYCIYTYSTIYSNLRLWLYSLPCSHSILYKVLLHSLTMHCYTFIQYFSLKHFFMQICQCHTWCFIQPNYLHGGSALKSLLMHLPACVGNTHRSIHTVHAFYHTSLCWIHSNISTICCLPARYLFSLLCD
jgi:hypothetical protein